MSDKDRRWGRRCDIGCESWPDSDDYNVCPVCGEETTRYGNVVPLSEQDARELRSAMLFKEFYAKYCDRKSQAEEGDLEPTMEQHDKYDALYPGGRPDH